MQSSRSYLVTAKLHAAEEATATSEVSDADLKEPTDPTILTRRVWLETEWNKFDDGSSVVEQTLGGLVGVACSHSDQDWAVRLKLPRQVSRSAAMIPVSQMSEDLATSNSPPAQLASG